MGDEDVVAEKPEPVANGNPGVEKMAEVMENTEPAMDKEGEHHSGEDKKDGDKVDAQKMDVDKEEVKESKEIEVTVEDEKVAKEGEKEEGKGETETDLEKQEIPGQDGGKEGIKSDEMEQVAKENTEKETKGSVEEVVDGMNEDEEKPEEPKEKKSSKKRQRSKNGAGEKNRSQKKELTQKMDEELKISGETKSEEPKTSLERREEEPKTPAVSSIERPVRERKSVERLVATVEKESAKAFHIEKGRGTLLRDIPNVAYRLFRKKNDDTFKLLHTILFGRRRKAAQVKDDISRFSGFVWHDNEEKQMIKVKEKLDKCVKEKLVEFCDVLDVPISRATSRKEDIVAKLIEFLMEPHVTTSELLSENEQGKKRKRVSKSISASDTPSKSSAKIRKKGESKKKSNPPEGEDESEEEKEDDMNGVPEEPNDEMSEPADSKEGSKAEESDKDKGKHKQGVPKSSAKKGNSETVKAKKITIFKKASPPPKKELAKSPSRNSKGNKDKSAKKSSGKKDDQQAKKLSTSMKSAPKESTDAGKEVLKVKDVPQAALRPSDDELRNMICEILKEVDFNTATFTDIVKLLAKRFDMDLTARKSSIKLMIQDELTKLADADDEEDESDVEKDDKKPSSEGVKA